jgi:hypothetical protein
VVHAADEGDTTTLTGTGVRPGDPPRGNQEGRDVGRDEKRAIRVNRRDAMGEQSVRDKQIGTVR